MSIMGIYGRPRKFMEHAESSVRGIDAGVSLDRLLGMQAAYLRLEGSFLNR